MAYFKDQTPLSGNAAYAGKMIGDLVNGAQGDSQWIVRCKAADTSIVSGDPVCVYPTVSGYYCDGVVDDDLQFVGVLQDPAGAAAAEVDVCIGGFTYAKLSTSHTCTAWGGTLEFTSNTLYPGATVHTTNSVGWCVSSGTQGTAGNCVIFLDRPWELIDSTTP
jgi:hypothetical protein